MMIALHTFIDELISKCDGWLITDPILASVAIVSVFLHLLTSRGLL